MKLGLLSAATSLAAVLVCAPVGAATSQKVEQSVWGVSGLPSYVNMYIYVPDKVAGKPPILVASHHCQGTAASTYSETKSSFVSLADKNGFIIIFPEATGHNCWDVGSAKSLKHDGGGDTQAIAQMVRYTLTKYKADAARVYTFGGSSGAMMTQALLGVYPDIFAAGVAISGVPCGCWAVDYTGDTASNGQWSGPCAGGQVSKTAQQWGDLVRAMSPGHSGHRPRVQLWHGTADTTISYKNQTEAVKEWTNVLALSDAPATTDSKFGGTHQLWKSQCGFGALETFSVDGAGHSVSWDVNTAVGFLGLDQVDSPDPEAAACPPAGGGGSAPVGGASAGGYSGQAAGGTAGERASSGGVAGSSGGAAPSVGGTSNGAGAGFAGTPGEAGRSSQGGAAANAGGNSGGAFAVAGNGAAGDTGPSEGCNCALERSTDRGAPRPSLFAWVAVGLALLRRSARSRAE